MPSSIERGENHLRDLHLAVLLAGYFHPNPASQVPLAKPSCLIIGIQLLQLRAHVVSDFLFGAVASSSLRPFFMVRFRS